MWSLGCILYEMMFMRKFIEESSWFTRDLSKIILKITGDNLQIPAHASYSQALNDLLRSLLIPDKTKRPSIDQIMNSSCFKEIDLHQFQSPFEKVEIVLKILSDRFGEQTVKFHIDSMRFGSSNGEDVQPWALGFLLRKIKTLLV